MEYNNLIDFENELWPKLVKDIKFFDQEEKPETIDLLQKKYEYEVPEKITPVMHVTY